MNVEVLNRVFQAIALVLFYFFIGFGSGLVLGMLVANAMFGRGKLTFGQRQEEYKKEAAQHNAQWNPAHERWQR